MFNDQKWSGSDLRMSQCRSGEGYALMGFAAAAQWLCMLCCGCAVAVQLWCGCTGFVVAVLLCCGCVSFGVAMLALVWLCDALLVAV